MNTRLIKAGTFCFGLVMVILSDRASGRSAERSVSEPVAESPKTDRAAIFELKPTAIAPNGVKGSARISQGSMAMHLSQLGAGVYYVQVVRRSDGIRQKLGTITISDPTASPSRQSTDNKKEASANPEMVMVETDATFSMPPGLNPRGVTRVMLLGAGGNAVLDSKPQ